MMNGLSFLKRAIIPISLFLVFSLQGCRIQEEGAGPVQEEKARENTAIASGILKVGKIDNKNQLAQGIWAHGYLGDYILENNQIRVIISNPEKSMNYTRSGGHILDLTLRKYTYDYINAIYTRVGHSPDPQYSYKRILVKTTGYPDNGAAIVVSGRSEDKKEAYTISTEYLLKPDSNVLEMTTTVTNISTGTLKALPVGDTIDWGVCSTFVGDLGIIGTGAYKRIEGKEWFCGFVDDFSAGFTCENNMIDGEYKTYKSVVSYEKPDLAVGETISCKRYLVVADKSLSKISDFNFKIRKSKFGFISGTVVQHDTDEPIPDVDVRIIVSRKGDQAVQPRPFTRIYSDEKGQFNLMVPEGSYFIQSKAFARRSARNPLSFFVPDGDTYVVKLKASRTSKLGFTCRDNETGELLPCKLTIVNIPPTNFVDRGPGTDLYARNVYYSASGDDTIDLPIGRYKVVFSRGIEYDTYEEEILVSYTTRNVINAKLNHVIDWEGYISADIGVRTSNSYDCFVSPEDRVVTAAAEGVEYLVSGDSNTATDLSIAVENKKLEKFLKTGIGKRIEYLGEENPGHFLVWPIFAEDLEAAADNSVLQRTSPRKIMETLRSIHPRSFIQICRPLFPFEGYFSRFGYDHKEKRLIEEKDFSYDFDLVEMWEGKRMGVTRESLQLFFDIVLTGHPSIIPMAGSFSRETVGEEVGYPRVYIASSTDDPSQITEADLLESVNKGNIMITNGPIIKFTVNGQPPGSMITDTDGEVECYIEVRAAPWVPMSHIDLNMDGIFLRRIIQPPSTEIQRFPKKDDPNDKKKGHYTVKIKKDTLLNVMVIGSGKNTLSPVVPPHPFQGTGVHTLAVTAPVIVDFDGNGKYDPPSKDMIGY